MVTWVLRKVREWRYRFAMWQMRRRIDASKRQMGQALLPALRELAKQMDALEREA